MLCIVIELQFNIIFIYIKYIVVKLLEIMLKFISIVVFNVSCNVVKLVILR